MERRFVRAHIPHHLLSPDCVSQFQKKALAGLDFSTRMHFFIKKKKGLREVKQAREEGATRRMSHYLDGGNDSFSLEAAKLY